MNHYTSDMDMARVNPLAGLGWIGFNVIILFYHEFAKITHRNGRSHSISKEWFIVTTDSIEQI